MQYVTQPQFSPPTIINHPQNNAEPPKVTQSQVSIGNKNSKPVTNRFIFAEKNSGKKINIFFETTVGNRYQVIAPSDMKLKNLFQKFLEKLKVSIIFLGNQIFFVSNANKFNSNEERTVAEMGIIDSSIIMVMDTHNLIGGKNKFI